MLKFDTASNEAEAMRIQSFRLNEGAYTSVRTEAEDGEFSIESEFPSPTWDLDGKYAVPADSVRRMRRQVEDALRKGTP